MKNKQTAVEWLAEKIQQAKPSFKFDALIRQAKEMEKEQIIDAYYYDPNCDNIKDDGEQYYTETYKSE
jgi:hypothetical protein